MQLFKSQYSLKSVEILNRVIKTYPMLFNKASFVWNINDHCSDQFVFIYLLLILEHTPVILWFCRMVYIGHEHSSSHLSTNYTSTCTCAYTDGMVSHTCIIPAPTELNIFSSPAMELAAKL